MRILILHPNFPGQFKNVCQHFAAMGHEVVFLCQTHYNRTIKGVNRIRLKGSLGNESLDELSLKAPDRAFKMGEQYLEAFQQLKEKSWNPDVVISHSGWGCGTFTRYVWHKTKIISYLEWWFNSTSEIYSYDDQNQFLGLTPESSKKHWQRNSLIAQELSHADHIVSPTKWQRSQLPEVFQKQCQVIYDGINLDKFTFSNKRVSKAFSRLGQYISYGTRGMEPMRGFPQFIQSIPLILQSKPQLKVVIAGEDEVHYGGNKPSQEGTWKKWAIKFLEKSNCISNVIWTGRLDEDKYIEWLQNSDCHVYLTHPYVLSWSFIEAFLCCDKVIASDVRPVQEFIGNDYPGLVDHRKPASIAKGVIRLLESPTTTSEAKSQIKFEKLGVNSCMEAWTVVAGLKVATDH